MDCAGNMEYAQQHPDTPGTQQPNCVEHKVQSSVQCGASNTKPSDTVTNAHRNRGSGRLSFFSVQYRLSITKASACEHQCAHVRVVHKSEGVQQQRGRTK